MPSGLALSGLSERDIAGVVRLVLSAWDTWREVDAEIDLGTAVCVSLAASAVRRHMTEEGVVIEVVPPGDRPRARRVAPCRCPRSLERYVVQCWNRRVLRPAAELVVVSR